MMVKPDAMIIDIDGTVADHTGIRGHYEYDKVSSDKPVYPVIIAVSDMWRSWDNGRGGIKPLFVSGRMDMNAGRVRLDTVDWLNRYFPEDMMNEVWLLMRQEFLPDGKDDYRYDYIVKEEIYHRDIEPNYHVMYCWDDRNQVVNMWRGLGITCFQVAEGNF